VHARDGRGALWRVHVLWAAAIQLGDPLMAIIIGTAANDTLVGTAGSDTLNGAAGADKLIGGNGNDTYVVDQAGDLVSELTNQGNDLVRAAVSTTLALNVERLELLSGADNGTGNTLNNEIIGNLTSNKLDGGTGNDEVRGGGGHDTVIGGIGNDVLYGDDGTDLLQGGSGNDELDGGELAANDKLERSICRPQCQHRRHRARWPGHRHDPERCLVQPRAQRRQCREPVAVRRPQCRHRQQPQQHH
jgi:hypothetical protein